MQVILIEDVPALGSIGDEVRVKGGYGRNYLLPRKLAIQASTKNRRQLEHQRRQVSFRAKKSRQADEAAAKRITDLEITIARKVGEQDKLYGSVTVLDIHEALVAQGVELDRRKIQLSEPIKTLGVFQVPVKLRADLRTELKVVVAAE